MNKEEAMKILKDFHDKSAIFSIRTALETLHPELKESEDERIRKDIIFYIKAIANNENISPDSKKECKTWIAWLEKQGEQKLDWNKEDEKMIGRLRDIVEKYAFSQSAVDVNGELCEKEYIEADNWLKSLKEKYTWKPSIAQLNALSIVSKGNAPDDIEAIVSLYNNLKKLTE